MAGEELEKIAKLGIEIWKEPCRIKVRSEVKEKMTADEYEAGKTA